MLRRPAIMSRSDALRAEASLWTRACAALFQVKAAISDPKAAREKVGGLGGLRGP